MARSGAPLTVERRALVSRLVADLTDAARVDEHVSALALCGSWASDRATMASDVDVVVVTDRRAALVADDRWACAATTGARRVRQRDWGPLLTELRYRLPCGLEVEINVVDAAWAATEPIDAGTERVVSDGFVVLCDRDGRLARLVRHLRR